MNRMNQPRTYSIRTKLILGLLAILIPLVGLLLTYNFYTARLLREKTALSNKNTLSIYSEIVDNNLQTVSKQLLDVFTADNNFYKIRNSSDSLGQFLAANNVSKRFQSLLANGTPANLFFVFSPQQRMVYFSENFRKTLPFTQRLLIRSELERFAQKENAYVRYSWTPLMIGNDYYLVNILGRDGVYFGTAVRLSDMVFPLTKGQLFDSCRMIYADAEGTALTENDFVAEKHLNLAASDTAYTLSGAPDRFMILSESLRSAPVRIVAALPDPIFLASYNTIQLFLFIASILTIFIIPLSLWLIRRSILRPVGDLVKTMEQIRAGDLQARADKYYASTEFRQVHETFNQMLDEIEHLKIDGYEKQLARQKAELQYLQFQIRPHFYLNSLKTLYGMAQNGKTGEIQQLILALSKHFRYLFKDNFTLVRLRDELNHVKNYITIQQMYTSQTYFCEIDVEEELLDLMIPPISIQTFVENSLKHGLQPDKPLEIRIRARILETEDGDFASITVLDNGPGFSDEQLDLLNFADPDMALNESIGLANVRQRFNILYNGRAHLAFANDLRTGGAQCELLIPLKSRPLDLEPIVSGQEADSHECSDRG
jgi:two-component system sensor histidine kinase YesM